MLSIYKNAAKYVWAVFSRENHAHVFWKTKYLTLSFYLDG